MEPLKMLQLFNDPMAFIAGGYALNYLGITNKHTDVDIFLPLKLDHLDANDLPKFLDNIEVCPGVKFKLSTELGNYPDILERGILASYYYFDSTTKTRYNLILHNHKSITSVLNVFDLSILKVAILSSSDIMSTVEYKEAFKTKVVTVRNVKYPGRIQKYKNRLPGYTFVEGKII